MRAACRAAKSDRGENLNGGGRRHIAELSAAAALAPRPRRRREQRGAAPQRLLPRCQGGAARRGGETPASVLSVAFPASRPLPDAAGGAANPGELGGRGGGGGPGRAPGLAAGRALRAARAPSRRPL